MKKLNFLELFGKRRTMNPNEYLLILQTKINEIIDHLNAENLSPYPNKYECEFIGEPVELPKEENETVNEIEVNQKTDKCPYCDRTMPGEPVELPKEEINLDPKQFKSINNKIEIPNCACDCKEEFYNVRSCGCGDIKNPVPGGISHFYCKQHSEPKEKSLRDACKDDIIVDRNGIEYWVNDVAQLGLVIQVMGENRYISFQELRDFKWRFKNN